jgi:hypothetical protein
MLQMSVGAGFSKKSIYKSCIVVQLDEQGQLVAQLAPVPSSKSPKEKSPEKKSPKKKSSPWKRKVQEWEEDGSEEEVEELSAEGDKESLKEKDFSDDDDSVGKLPAITQAKKRRTINEDMDADGNKVIPSN